MVAFVHKHIVFDGNIQIGLSYLEYNNIFTPCMPTGRKSLKITANVSEKLAIFQFLPSVFDIPRTVIIQNSPCNVFIIFA